jgi:hypothetical protein
MADTPDEVLLKDIKDFIDVGLITNTEAISFSLALLYNALGKDEQKELIEKVCEVSKMINEFFSESVADKQGASVSFMFALIYMLANMNATMMFDEHWKKLIEKGTECQQSFLAKSVGKSLNRKDDNRGYC